MPDGTHQPEFAARPSERRIATVFAAAARPSLTVAAVLVALAAGACSTAPPGTPVVDEEEAKLPPRERSMRITSGYGGTHRHSVIENGIWYQSFENRILFLDAQTGTELVDLELAPRGTTGVVSDFLVRGERLFAVLEDDWVVELDIAAVREPKLQTQWGRAELGIRPTFVAAIGDEIYISGDGGVVRLSEATPHGTLSIDSKGRAVAPERPTPMLEGRDVGRVVAAKGGPVACVGRRILRIEDGSFLGSASMLIELPDAVGGGYGFMRQSTEGASVGLMDAEFRERSATALRGQVYSIRFFDDRFFAINDFEVATWRMEEVPQDPAASAGDASAAAPKREFVLGALLSVPVKGARDIAKVQRNRFAVAGSFGRALYRYLPEGDKPGDTFYWSRRYPGRLDVAVTDRRRVHARRRDLPHGRQVAGPRARQQRARLGNLRGGWQGLDRSRPRHRCDRLRPSRAADRVRGPHPAGRTDGGALPEPRRRRHHLRRGAERFRRRAAGRCRGTADRGARNAQRVRRGRGRRPRRRAEGLNWDWGRFLKASER